MKKERFFLSLVLMAFASVSVIADKYTDQYGATFTYSVKKNCATIKSMSDNLEKVRIPSFVVKNGKRIPVKVVDLFDASALYGSKFNTKVLQIDEGVEEVKSACFADFSQLYEVYIPKSVKKIGKNAFKNGRNISFPQLPQGVIVAELLAGKEVNPEVEISVAVDPILAGNQPNDLYEEQVVMQRKMGVAGESDVDVFVPSGGVQRDKTFCLIIANEKYSSKDTPNVSWAETDGTMFFKYCRTTLGIPQENIRFVKNADYLGMKKQIEWLEMVSKHYGNVAKFIFYYAGHGAPDDKGKCYLIPRNGSINDLTTGYPLSDVYGMLGSMSAQSALVLVDACFSGTDRHDLAMVQGKRGIARTQEQKVSGNIVSITAASNSETAFAYDEKAHGLFTYYLLKALQEKRGEISYGELYDYIRQNVSGKSILLMDKEQTPSVSFGSHDNSWREIKF